MAPSRISQKLRPNILESVGPVESFGGYRAMPWTLSSDHRSLRMISPLSAVGTWMMALHIGAMGIRHDWLGLPRIHPLETISRRLALPRGLCMDTTTQHLRTGVFTFLRT
ncbi:hypothetical protein NLI96_g286 [Meripilus lineatus]|uniref:Uncharacterized protein n=1 Tax=Meripilus lineatus TaxID=2056292 RepID=A0AAD5VCK5_9APHY|nr:hypothetical protein NLI96_g286 [Physisporinus lineatus]